MEVGDVRYARWDAGRKIMVYGIAHAGSSGVCRMQPWIPASAGMTMFGSFGVAVTGKDQRESITRIPPLKVRATTCAPP